MKLELAENYGFCFGVKRAIKIAEENQNASTYGSLIHNAKEIHRLQKDFNVSLQENILDFKQGDKVVIRTHGVPKSELQFLKNNHIDVIDATCPYVTKPQQICEQMSKDGYDVVIYGDESHPEIKGVKSYAQNGAYVVTSLHELKQLNLKEKVALVAQTTRKIEDYAQMANYLVPKYKEVRVFNTICNATFENQDAVRKLAKKVDIMIIIGGKNSSNTKQLLNIAGEYCTDSYHIEDKEGLNLQWFEGKAHCGITAGASTPDWIIQNVIDSIQKL